MAAKFEIFIGKNEKHYFRLKAGNGEPILASQAYASKDGCENGIASVKENSADDSKFEMKESSNGKPYFVLKAGNGQVIGKSEMYSSESSAKNGIASVQKNAPDAPVVEV